MFVVGVHACGGRACLWWARMCVVGVHVCGRRARVWWVCMIAVCVHVCGRACLWWVRMCVVSSDAPVHFARERFRLLPRFLVTARDFDCIELFSSQLVGLRLYGTNA